MRRAGTLGRAGTMSDSFKRPGRGLP